MLDHLLSLTPARIKQIRAKYQLSQSKFAIILSISVRTLQNWEIGHRVPSSPAQSLLRVAEENPNVFLKRKKMSPEAKEIIKKLLMKI